MSRAVTMDQPRADHARATTPDPLVGVWLAVVCALVAAMILVGGATRLTDSGLSITEWDVMKHFVPPLTERGWQEEFDLYRRTTEYQVQNRGMALDEFRFIYLWEWGHRFLGQTVGLVFGLPFLLFWATGRLKGRLLPVAVLGAMGALQGAIGWWMVTSGLYGRLDVSSVRLAVHLGMAFLILGLGFWLMRDAFSPRRRKTLRPDGWTVAFAVALYAQILLGALVAGADAGRAYSDWPTIGGRWIPDYAGYGSVWAQFTENLAAVQFHHRVTGYAVAALAIWLAVRARRGPALHVAALTVAQAGLGIATVMIGAPLWISLMHQGLAILLWLGAIALVRGSMIPREKYAGPQGAPAAI